MMRHPIISNPGNPSFDESALVGLKTPSLTKTRSQKHVDSILVLESFPDSLQFFEQEYPNQRRITSIFRVPKGLRFDQKKSQFLREEGCTAQPILVRSNDLQELVMTHHTARHCWGRVLCIGCGIGAFQQFAQSNEAVLSVMTVDDDEELVQLTRTYLPEHNIVCADPLEFLESTRDKFDCIFIHDHNRFDSFLIQRANRLAKLALGALTPSTTSRVFAWGYFEQVAKLQAQALRQTATVIAEPSVLKLDVSVDELLKESDPFTWKLLHWLKGWWLRPGSKDTIPSTESILEQATSIAFQL